MHLQNIRMIEEEDRLGKQQIGQLKAVRNFGFHITTCCGYIPLDNRWCNDWVVRSRLHIHCIQYYLLHNYNYIAIIMSHILNGCLSGSGYIATLVASCTHVLHAKIRTASTTVNMRIVLNVVFLLCFISFTLTNTYSMY